MSAFTTNPITTVSTNINTTQNNCRKYNGFYPSFAPVISSLSITESIPGQYALVYIFGYNFFPNGTTYINFGQYKNIPITFYSSNNISFVVPLQATDGTYNVVVVNIYNGNFSSPVKYSYPGNLNYSNSVTYFLTYFNIVGTYTITSDSSYNYIVTFTNNSTITFYKQVTINSLIVGGGGGGCAGAFAGGGGGGGGQVINSLFSSVSGNSYYIKIGQGGNGGLVSSGRTGIAGKSSSLNGNNVYQIADGGYPGYQVAVPSTTNGYLNGGNSGAGGIGGFGIPGIGTTPGYDGTNGGGGGGGQAYSGNGGNGAINNINSNYGGGGGGGGGYGNSSITPGSGGTGFGGGGNGGYYTDSNIFVAPKDGTSNTGGGGGGGCSITYYPNGANGGSGVVILYF